MKVVRPPAPVLQLHNNEYFVSQKRCVCSEEGRLRAAFFSCATLVLLLVLSGCAHEIKLMRDTLQAVTPWHQDVSEHAAELPYASIDITVEGNGGLVVMAERSSDHAYFQSGNRDIFVLHNGYLDQTAGLMSNLMMTRIHQVDGILAGMPWHMADTGEAFEYLVQRIWRSKDGVLHADQAHARLVCHEHSAKKTLPLGSLVLQRCLETLTWSDGTSTQSILWRHPDSHQLWAVHTVPWPGAPEIHWEVARPWWH